MVCLAGRPLVDRHRRVALYHFNIAVFFVAIGASIIVLALATAHDLETETVHG